MKCRIKFVGYCTLAFGAGVMLSCILPAKAMVFMSAAVLLAAGAAVTFT